MADFKAVTQLGAVTDAGIKDVLTDPSSQSAAALNATIVASFANPQPADAVAIFGVFGQSNAAGRASDYDTTRIDISDPRVLAYSSANDLGLALWNSDGNFIEKVAVAVEPLHHADGAHGLGHATTFAKRLVAAAPGYQRVLLVPRAVGGTPIDDTGNAWGAGSDPANPANPGAVLYENAIRGMQRAAAECDRLGLPWFYAGIVWHQGENNRTSTNAYYQTHLDALFNGFRARLGVLDLPIILGTTIYEQLNGGNNEMGIRAVHIDTARRLTRTGVFYAPGPGYQIDTGTNAAHFTADGQRILGNHALEAFAIALANVTGVAPLPPRAVHLAQSGATIKVWWDRPLGRATDYKVQYQLGAGSWTDAPHTAGPFVTGNVDCGQADIPAVTLTGVTEGQTYSVRVATINEQGQSDWAAASLAVVTAPAKVTGLAAGTATQSTIPLSWTAVAGADSYKVEYSADGGTTWTTAATVTGTSTTVAALTPNTAYRVRVTGQNAAGLGTASDVLSTSTSALDVLASALSGMATGSAFGYWSAARRLVDTYTGPLIRVRRSSDSTEQDIPQTTGKVLDEASLTAFLAGSDGYVTTVYEQGGASTDLVQTTAANQPTIAAAGVVSKVNGRPAITQTATQMLENASTGLYAAGAATIYAVHRSTGAGALISETGTSGNPRYFPISAGTSGNTLSRLLINDAGTTVFNANTNPQKAVSAGYHCSGVIDAGATSIIRQDGATIDTATIARTGTVTVSRLGAFGDHRSGYVGTAGLWSELVAFTAALVAADYQAIEANQKAWFTTAA